MGISKPGKNAATVRRHASDCWSSRSQSKFHSMRMSRSRSRTWSRAGCAAKSRLHSSAASLSQPAATRGGGPGRHPAYSSSRRSPPAFTTPREIRGLSIPRLRTLLHRPANWALAMLLQLWRPAQRSDALCLVLPCAQHVRLHGHRGSDLIPFLAASRDLSSRASAASAAGVPLIAAITAT